MTPRDTRRRAAYERLLRPDSGASENERKVAAAELAKLRAAHPDGWATEAEQAHTRSRGPKEERARKAYRPHTPDWQDFASHFRWYSAGGSTRDESDAPDAWSRYDDPAAKANREAAEAEYRRAHNANEVKRQRAWVESIPGWQTSATLTELHGAVSAWDDESQRRFKDARAHLTGSSRASDL